MTCHIRISDFYNILLMPSCGSSVIQEIAPVTPFEPKNIKVFLDLKNKTL